MGGERYCDRQGQGGIRPQQHDLWRGGDRSLDPASDQSVGWRSEFVVDVHDFGLDKARESGASAIFNNLRDDAIQEILARTAQMGVDRSYEAVRLEVTLVQSLQALKKGSPAVLVGLFEEPTLNIPANIFVQKGISLSGSQGYDWDFQAGLRLIEEGRLDLEPLLTHEYPWKEFRMPLTF